MGFLNTRPLTYTSNDPLDEQPLRPVDFLQPGLALQVREKVDQNAVSMRSNYKRMQALMDRVWQRWTKEYLPQLMTRVKWQQEERDLRVGDIVLMVEDNLPRGQWMTGRIVAVERRDRGHVRKVRVLTPQGAEYERAITKCCLLEEAELHRDSDMEEDRDELESQGSVDPFGLDPQGGSVRAPSPIV